MPLNRMDNLLNKIERRLGTKVLMLPDEVKKDIWVDEFIIPDSLLTFSRYYPHMVRIKINTMDPKAKKDNYFLIDTDLLGGAEILGVKDIAWDVYGQEDGGLAQQSGIGMYDYLSAYNNYSMDDVMLLQARADLTSVFNNSIFVDFKQPNMVRLQTATHGDVTGGMGVIPLDLFVVHPPNLMTIPATMMEIFEDLATADVASGILAVVGHFDNLETVYSSSNPNLDRLKDWEGRRPDLINTLKESYVSASNKNQPLILCV